MKSVRGSFNLIFVAVMALFIIGTAVGQVDNMRGFPAGARGKVKGLILSRNGDLINLREDGSNRAVVIALDELTQVQLKKKGPLGVVPRKKDMDVTALLPGLRVEAQGTGNSQGQLVAATITFDPDDFKTAKAIHSQVSPLNAKQSELEAQQRKTAQEVQQAQMDANQANAGVAELHERMSSLDDYDTKYLVTTYFTVNKASLSDDAKKELDDLAQKALVTRGYMIEVAGYADTSGNAQKNQELSEKRAEAVVQYLQQVGKIPLRRILSPVGLGTTNSVADNNTAEGRQKNRRVEVRLIVNKGISS